MYKFSYRSDDEISKNLSMIAAIILQEKFDIVAMQEVMNKGVMSLLQMQLGFQNWEFAWEQPPARGRDVVDGMGGEGYAFLWNNNRIRPVETGYTTGIREFIPRIFSQYSVDDSFRKRNIKLERDPYYGRFTPQGLPGGGFFEFRIINTHIRYSKYKDKDIGSVPIRKNEFQILAECIYPKICDRRYGNNMPAYTILLGDYNLNLLDSGAGSPYVSPLVFYTDAGRTRRITTVQTGLSTLKQKQEGTLNELMNGTEEANAASKNNGIEGTDVTLAGSIIKKELEKWKVYSNNYDHFTYDEDKFDGIGLTIERVDAVRKYYKGDVEAYRREVSDHVPVVIDIDLKSRRGNTYE